MGKSDIDRHLNTVEAKEVLTMDVQNIAADFYSADQLAAELSVSIRTLSRWSRMRKGPARIKVGRTCLYRRAAVQEWLKSLEADCAVITR